MRRILGSIVITIAITSVAVGGVSGTAFADSSSSSSTAAPGGNALATVKAKAATAVSLRLTALNTAVTTVNADGLISAADKSTLLATLNGDLSGLSALGPKIQGDTTLQAATTDYKTIFTGYRVFALAIPQVRFAASADDLTAAVLPALTNAQSNLQALLAGPDAGKNTGAVQAAMADLASQIQAITTSTNGLSTSVLAITPAQWDATPTILSGPRNSLVTARADRRTAEQDIRTVVGDLK